MNSFLPFVERGKEELGLQCLYNYGPINISPNLLPFVKKVTLCSAKVLESNRIMKQWNLSKPYGEMKCFVTFPF